MIPLRLDFDIDPAAMPFRGNTPAAKHASWTGAQVAAIEHGSNLLKLLSLFAQLRRMTFADFCKFMKVTSEHRLCSTWASAKEMGWIVGTGEYESYTKYSKVVHREIHVITRKGLRAQLERLRAKVEQIEAGS